MKSLWELFDLDQVKKETHEQDTQEEPIGLEPFVQEEECCLWMLAIFLIIAALTLLLWYHYAVDVVDYIKQVGLTGV